MSIARQNFKRHGRPRERLLKAATILFSSHGYRGTTTQQIAALAGVNQVTVFRLFRTKRALLLKVLEQSIKSDALDWLQKTLQSSRPDAVVFERLANHLGKIFEPTFVRLLLFGELEQPHEPRKLLRSHLGSFYRQVADHLQQRVDSGELRALDPASMCRAFVAMLIYEQVFRDVFEDRRAASTRRSKPNSLYLDIWLNGVLARPGQFSPLVSVLTDPPEQSDGVGRMLPSARMRG